MQIKFLNIYNPSYTELCQVQYELLGFWQKSIVNDQVDFIRKAKVEFKEYSFAEYPDQEKLNSEIKKSLPSGYNHLHNTQFWQYAGNNYYVFEDLYSNLAGDHHLMELVITVEDSDV